MPLLQRRLRRRQRGVDLALVVDRLACHRSLRAGRRRRRRSAACPSWALMARSAVMVGFDVAVVGAVAELVAAVAAALFVGVDVAVVLVERREEDCCSR